MEHVSHRKNLPCGARAGIWAKLAAALQGHPPSKLCWEILGVEPGIWS